MPVAMSYAALFRKNKKRNLRAKYQNGAAWRHFTDGICQSVEVKHALHEAQGGRCAACWIDITSRTLDDSTIHHVSYDHRCTFGGNATQTPSCGACLITAPCKAQTCLTHLRLVHTTCHKALHGAERRDPAWRGRMGLDS